MKNFILLSLLLLCFSVNAQTGIGTSTPDPSAVLDVSSSMKGFLPPRLNDGQRATLDAKGAVEGPAKGLVIYNTSQNCLQVNVGTKLLPNWECLNNSTSVNTTPCDPVSFTVNNSTQSVEGNTALRLTTSNHSPSPSDLNWTWTITSQVSGSTASIVPVGNNSRADFTADLAGSYTITVTGQNTSIPASNCAPTNAVQSFNITVFPAFEANITLSGCSVSGSNNNYNVCAGNFTSVTATVNTGSATGTFIGPGSWTFNGTLLNYNTFRCPYTGNYTLYYDMYATVTGSGSARMPNVTQLDNGISSEQAILNRFASFTCTAGQVPPQNSGGLNPVNQAGGTNGALNGFASSRFQNVRIEYNGPN